MKNYNRSFWTANWNTWIFVKRYLELSSYIKSIKLSRCVFERGWVGVGQLSPFTALDLVKGTVSHRLNLRKLQRSVSPKGTSDANVDTRGNIPWKYPKCTSRFHFLTLRRFTYSLLLLFENQTFLFFESSIWSSYPLHTFFNTPFHSL